jgi:hypothetical protein
MESIEFDYHKAYTEGHGYNEEVANRLRAEGIRCTVPELTFARNSGERRYMTRTEKDIICNDLELVLEVKSRSLKFTGVIKKFPDWDIIVDTVSGFDQKEIKPYAYIMISQVTKEILVVPTKTRFTWTKEKRFDPFRKHWDTFYKCQKDYFITWDEFITDLRGKTHG